LVSNIALYVVRRAINAVVTIIFLILMIFLMVHIVLPNPLSLARMYALNSHASLGVLQEIAVQYGLNQPWPIQFVHYVINIFSGNFGIDTQYHISELQVMGTFIPITLELVVVGQILGVVIGLYTGSISAANRNNPIDYGTKAVYLTTWSAPAFVVAFIMQFIFAFGLKLLPASGVVDPTLPAPAVVTGVPMLDSILAGNWTYLWSLTQHILLPALTLAVISFGIVTRISRSSMIDALDKDYVKLAYMKGLSKSKVIWGTAFRNALIPIITLVALIFAFSAGGAVIVEDVFFYHGAGWFTVNAIYNFDYPAILAFTVIIGLSVVVANLVADLLYAVADPRVRLT
jgi:peptide/nickel transport system permease protein